MPNFAPGWNPPPIEGATFESPIFDISCISMGASPIKSYSEGEIFYFEDDKVYLAPGNIMDMFFNSTYNGTYTYNILLKLPDQWITIVNSYTADVDVVIQDYNVPGLAFQLTATLENELAVTNIFIRFSD